MYCLKFFNTRPQSTPALRRRTARSAGTDRRLAAFLAATCHRDYRRRGGRRASILPDLFIGAHATVLEVRLLARDAARYRTSFPTVDVTAPCLTLLRSHFP